MENKKKPIKEDLYDKVCEVCLINLYTLSKESDGLYFSNFNAKNKEHLFELHMAVHAANLQNKRIYIDANIFTRIKLWWPFRHCTNFFKRVKHNVSHTIDTEEVLSFMRAYAEECVYGKDSEYMGNIFADIYDAYYNRKAEENAI